MPIVAPNPEQVDEFGRRIMLPPAPEVMPQAQQQQPLNPALLQAPATQPMLVPPPNMAPSQFKSLEAYREAVLDRLQSHATQSIPAATQSIPIAPQPMAMAPPGPAQAGIAALHAPQMSDYPVSRGTKILAAIAGGLAGASGGARTGIETASAITHGPYNKAVDQFGRNTDLLKLQAGEEAKRQELPIKQASTQANVQYKSGDLDVKRENADTNRGKLDNAKTNTESIIAHRKALEEYNAAKAANPKLDDTQWAYAGKTPEEQQARQDFVKENNEFKRLSTEEVADRAGAVKTKQLEAQDTPLGRRVAINQPVQKATEIAEIKDKMPLSPDTEAAVNGAVARSKANPDAIHDIAKEVPGGPRGKAAYWARLAEGNIPIPKQITDKTVQTAVTNAQTAIKHVKTIEQLVKDPEIQSHLGPIMGRITELGQTIGAPILSSKDGGAKEAQLLSVLRYLVTFEASSTSGTRPSWQLIKFLQGTSPSAHLDPEKFRGALDGVIASAGNRIEAAYEPSSMGKPVDNQPKRQIIFHDKE